MSDQEDMDQSTAFQHAVNRLATMPGFMAYLLSAAFQGDVSVDRIARELDCSQDVALRLALMTEPGAERDAFRQGIAVIAKDTGIDPGRLMHVIRQGRALGAFDHPGQDILLAARDHLQDNEDD